MGSELAQVACVSTRGTFKRHGGASTGSMNQTLGKSHHRYVHGMRTKEVIAMRKVVAEMKKSLGDLVELI